MFWTLFYLIVVFFTLGAIAITRLNRKSDAEQRQARWIKYIFYLIAVIVTTFCIKYGVIFYFSILLLLIGLYEVFIAWKSAKKSVKFLIISLFIYGVIAYCFYQFSNEIIIERILYVYTIVFTFDGFAQITGQLFGKKKILPTISPDKTIAGVIGGYVMGITTGVFVMQWLGIPEFSIWFSPFLICTGAFVGDALASFYKRRCSIKDYSQLIPGHGGVLDRYDSFIFAGAVFWVFYL